MRFFVTTGLWTKVAYPSLKPLSSWFPDMVDRVGFFDKWVTNGPPICFWISAFFFPQGFLTSVLQNYSRSNQLPVDVLGFDFAVQHTDDPEELEKELQSHKRKPIIL